MSAACGNDTFYDFSMKLWEWVERDFNHDGMSSHAAWDASIYGNPTRRLVFDIDVGTIPVGASVNLAWRHLTINLAHRAGRRFEFIVGPVSPRVSTTISRWPAARSA
jgi:hypothetical protein